jgi:hypothetical protein
MSALQSRKSSQSLYPHSHTFRVDLRPPSRHRLSRLQVPGPVTVRPLARRTQVPLSAQIPLRHCPRFRDRTWLGKKSRGRPSNPDDEKPGGRYCATIKA